MPGGSRRSDSKGRTRSEIAPGIALVPPAKAVQDVLGYAFVSPAVPDDVLSRKRREADA